MEDIEEVQGQYTNCEAQVELDNCKVLNRHRAIFCMGVTSPLVLQANFKNVLMLYECYAGVLGLFGEACIQIPEPKWTFLDWCQNRKTTKQFSDGLPSVPVRTAHRPHPKRYLVEVNIGREKLRATMTIEVRRIFAVQCLCVLFNRSIHGNLSESKVFIG